MALRNFTGENKVGKWIPPSVRKEVTKNVGKVLFAINKEVKHASAM